MALRLRRGTDAERQLPGFIPESGELIYTTDTKLVYVGDGVTEGGLPISSGAFATSLITDLSPQLGGDLALNTHQISGTGNIDITGSISATGDIITQGAVDSASVTAPSVTTDTIAADTSVSISLGSTLDLNNNNIIGTGNINIDGTINATGNINLGDSDDDNINLAGVIASNIIPSADSLYNIGADSFRWEAGFFNQLNTDQLSAGIFTAESITVGNTSIDGLSDTISTSQLLVDNIYSSDSSVVYDDSTKTLTANDVVVDNIVKPNGDFIFQGLADEISASSVVGDLRGSVFGDDSAVFFDAVNNIMSVDTTFISSISSDLGVLEIGRNIPTRVSIFHNTGGAVVSGRTLSSQESFIELNTCNGDIEVPTAVEANNSLSGLILGGYDGDEFSRSIAVAGFVDDAGVVAPGHISGKLMFVVANAAGDGDVVASFNSHGVFNAPVIRTGNVTDVTERDAQTGTEAGSILLVNSNDKGNTDFQGYDGTNWVSLSNNNASAKTVTDETTGSFTVSASDLGSVITLRASGTINLPDASNTDIPVGFYVDFFNMTGSATTFSSDVASQIVSSNGTAPAFNAQGAAARATKVSTTEWFLSGDLTTP